MYDNFVTLLDVFDYEFMSLYSRRRKGSKGLFPPFQEIMTDRPTDMGGQREATLPIRKDMM